MASVIAAEIIADLEIVVVSTAVDAGLSLLSASLFKQKGSDSPIKYPPNDISRGGYLPLVLGRRVVGAQIGWVGDRHSEAATHGGGSEIFGAGPTGNMYFEGGWHQLCHGPVRKLHRIWAGGKVVFAKTIDRDTTPSGSMMQLAVLNGSRISDYFRIYWGDDPQPVDAYLQSQTNLVSMWPGLCYIVWQRKNLGSAPQWTLMKYEIETDPDDIFATATMMK